jgi:lysophospholipid acyltransferase (LPLAT)-like uncharacterized protein
VTTDFDNAYRFGSLEKYTFRQRIEIRIASFVFYWLIRAIGLTMRFETTGYENFDSITAAGRLPIYCFWHNRIIPGTYFFRDRGIIVMSSASYDSEYTTRCIQRFGYGFVRGSSTRGGTRALVSMIKMMKAGYAMAFTVDGPRGPRYEVKPGPILLAKKTGNALMPFIVESRSFWTIKSWDRLQIPKPFTAANVMIAPPIYVDPEANDDELESKRLELQAALDRLVEQGAAWRNAG